MGPEGQAMRGRPGGPGGEVAAEPTARRLLPPPGCGRPGAHGHPVALVQPFRKWLCFLTAEEHDGSSTSQL